MAKKKPEDGEQIQITARLPRALYRDARIQAISEDSTFAALMQRALIAYVKRPASVK